MYLSLIHCVVSQCKCNRNVCVFYLIPLSLDLLPLPLPLLSTDVLVAKKSEEKASAVFTKMPSPHYMEIATLLLNR